MLIKTEDFTRIVEYIRDELLRHMQLVNTIGVSREGDAKPVPINAVSEFLIMGIPQAITLESFLAVTGEKKERSKPQEKIGDFAEFWKAYPASASFIYKGMSFQSSRCLRANYQVCEMLYNKTVHETSGVSPAHLLRALQKQVKMIKEESYQSGTNGLQYFPALEVYLRQQRWEPFIGESENNDDGTVSGSQDTAYSNDQNCG